MAPSSIRNGAFSPPHSSAASYTTSVQSKLNVVSRLAIEGKVKQGADGASIKLYLKITVPVDSVTPAQILPLFAEENVKIRDFQVHPLDSDSAPYNFSSTTNPLLHNTARALNLPARSTKSYLSLFDSAAHSSPTRSSSVNGSVIPPLEERYTGYFLISGYNICFALPREFPPKYRINTGGTDSDGDGLSSRGTPRTQYRSGRRASIGERSSLQFMAGLSLWIPLLSKPPRAPYMLSIPIPRCLSNNIKVRLPSPTPISTSFASLSSDEDSGGWDLATEPHVTRTSKLGRRASVYNEFADDESSEASVAGVSENCMIRGTFTSSDIIRIRWASPLKMQDFPDQGDGRRRVGVSEVKGHMTCTILDTLPEGVKMRLDYQGTCTGVWFPGVATLLGMDVGLDANGCRVTWPGNSDGQWTVDGDPALTGFTVGLPQNTLTRQNSLELPQVTLRESPDVSGLLTGETLPNGRGPSTSSASLLRAPLPTRQVSAEYSFEDSMTPTTSGLPSSVPSITTSMTRSSFGLDDDMSERIARPPSTPITLQMNISDLMPSAKNKFMFNISGTVIVSQSMAMYDSRDSLGTTLLLPIFRVFSAEKESVSNAVRNQCDGADVKLLESTDSLPSGKAKGTAVPYGSQMKYGLEGSEILVKPVVPKAVEEQSFSSRCGDHSLAMTSRPSSPEPASAVLQSQRSVVFRDGPLVIPWVNADVVPLSSSSEKKSWSYAVTVSLPTPVDGPSEWLEFGLSLPSELSVSGAPPVPEVEVICASVNGVPIRFEALGHTAPGVNNLSTPGAASSSKQRWLSWVRVHIALVGALEVVYIVKGRPGNEARRGKEKAAKNDDDEVNVFIPVFSIPVSRFEISLRHSSDVTAQPGVLSSLDQTLYRKITTYNVAPFSHADIKMPHPLFASKTKTSHLHRNTKRALLGFVAALPYIFSAILFSHVIGTRSELRELKAMVPGNWTEVFPTPASNIVAAAETHTVTSTVTVSTCKPTPTPTSTSTSSERRWFGDTYTVSYSSPAETTKVESSSSSSDPVSSSSQSQPPPRQTAPVIPERAFDSDEDIDGPPQATDPNVPMIYVPSSWPIHFRYERAKAHVIGGWGRVWRVVEIILHWPLPVDADT